MDLRNKIMHQFQFTVFYLDYVYGFYIILYLIVSFCGLAMCG